MDGRTGTAAAGPRDCFFLSSRCLAARAPHDASSALHEAAPRTPWQRDVHREGEREREREATGTHHTKRSLSDQRAHALEQTQTHAHEAWATGTKVHTHPKRRRRRPYVKHRLRQPVLSSNLRLCMRPGQASAPRAGRAGPRRSAPLARRSAMDTRPCCQAPAARATTAAYTCLATARTCRSSP